MPSFLFQGVSSPSLASAFALLHGNLSENIISATVVSCVFCIQAMLLQQLHQNNSVLFCLKIFSSLYPFSKALQAWWESLHLPYEGSIPDNHWHRDTNVPFLLSAPSPAVA